MITMKNDSLIFSIFTLLFLLIGYVILLYFDILQCIDLECRCRLTSISHFVRFEQTIDFEVNFIRTDLICSYVFDKTK